MSLTFEINRRLKIYWYFIEVIIWFFNFAKYVNKGVKYFIYLCWYVHMPDPDYCMEKRFI